ncbi:hydroxyethylthiazole kinase [Bifidobacterium magnum]|uniref:Hydroxyethylthiazole kinase n=1 Tax=Bifidobacterium magnum TaxID=1692 RepID=A0A087BDS8_9BIFI|nr:hydroxyethylthiazole kinase [Bifidobacterium magnum]KFI69178.1 Hydroxyethylthiazole kinase [Bifidobacterium magnum]
MTSHTITPSTWHAVDADDPIRARIVQAARDVRERTPLAQSFTNFVTMNFVANAQLAAGGSAAMSLLDQDIVEISSVAGATYINVGTLLPSYQDALHAIVRAFKESGHMWVLDPVAAGLGAARTAILTDMANAAPNIVRGNASELIALASMWGLQSADGSSRPEGVESVDDVESAAAAARAAAQFITTERGEGAVAVSGAIDLVTDGDRTFRLPGGSPLMTKITGAGCSLGGVTATYLCVTDPLTAALAASLLYNRASEMAAEHAHGPGSFQAEFLDALWTCAPEDIANGELFEVRD